MTRTSGGLPRLAGLDALRAIACLGVVAFHFGNEYPQLYGDGKARLDSLDIYYFVLATFFTLSGFGIFVFLETCTRLRDFLASRLVRLFPLYWACALITFATVTLLGPQDRAVDVGTALVNLTMTQYWFGVSNVDNPYWTLAVELNFYMWVAIAFRLGWLHGRRLGWALGIWAAVSLAVASPFGAAIPAAGLLQYGIFRADFTHFFVAGICLSLARRHGGHTRWTTLGVLWIFPASFVLHGPGGVLTVAVVLGLVLLAVRGRLGPLGHPAVARFGAITYALYLIHMNVGFTIMYHLVPATDYLIGVTTAFLVTVAAAFALHHWVERPSERRLRTALRATSYFAPPAWPIRPRDGEAADAAAVGRRAPIRAEVVRP